MIRYDLAWTGILSSWRFIVAGTARWFLSAAMCSYRVCQCIERCHHSWVPSGCKIAVLHVSVTNNLGLIWGWPWYDKHPEDAAALLISWNWTRTGMTVTSIQVQSLCEYHQVKIGNYISTYGQEQLPWMPTRFRLRFSWFQQSCFSIVVVPLCGTTPRIQQSSSVWICTVLQHASFQHGSE